MHLMKRKKPLHSSTLKELKVDQELMKGLNVKVGEVPERCLGSCSCCRTIKGLIKLPTVSTSSGGL